MNKLSAIILAACVACASAGEVTNEIRTVSVKMMCDTSGCKGEMKPTGQCLTSYPPQYPHVCSVCKTNRTFHIYYPELRYLPITSDLIIYTTKSVGLTLPGFQPNAKLDVVGPATWTNWTGIGSSKHPKTPLHVVGEYEFLETVVTNWVTIGTFTPLTGQTEDVQRGNIATNTTAILEWKGKRFELLLESVTGPECGEKRVPKPITTVMNWRNGTPTNHIYFGPATNYAWPNYLILN